MNCEKVIRELVVPTDDRDSAALAEHLANCPSCTSWAKNDAQFGRLWNATRPIEPSPQVWDTVWAYIASSLDSSTPTKFEAIASHMAIANGSLDHAEKPLGLTPASPRSRPWNWAAIGLIGLSQAAAVLLAVGWAWHGLRNSQEPQVAVATRSSAFSPDSSRAANKTGLQSVPVVEIETGQQVVIRIEDSAAKVVDLSPDGMSFSVDDWYLVFNAVEAIANPALAMKE
jgi:hypothetical protein